MDAAPLALNTKDSLRDLFVRKWSFVFRFEFDHLFIGVPSVLICGRLSYSVRDRRITLPSRTAILPTL
jgi:hypothetical protein